MKWGRAGFCNVVYAMQRFLKISVLLYVYLRIIIPGLCSRFILLNLITVQLMHTYGYFMFHIYFTNPDGSTPA